MKKEYTIPDRYCVSCKEKTESLDEEKFMSKNNKPMVRSTCGKCKHKKTQFTLMFGRTKPKPIITKEFLQGKIDKLNEEKIDHEGNIKRNGKMTKKVEKRLVAIDNKIKRFVLKMQKIEI